MCRLRDIPIITFINKVDREGLDPFELLDEIGEKLALDICPLVWPIGMGGQFHGCYDFQNNNFLTSSGALGSAYDKMVPCSGIDDEQLDALIDDQLLETVRENMELAQGAYPEFNTQAYQEGHLSPVIFGSALRDYCIEPLLDLIATQAPIPQAGKSQFLAFRKCVADPDGTVIRDTNNITRMCILRNFTVLGKKYNRAVDHNILARAHLFKFHAALEMTRCET